MSGHLDGPFDPLKKAEDALRFYASERNWLNHREIRGVPGFHGCQIAANALAALDALPERSKAILALAELTDEELVERVAMALSARHGSEVTWAQDREAAPDVLAALGLPVEQETTG